MDKSLLDSLRLQPDEICALINAKAAKKTEEYRLFTPKKLHPLTGEIRDVFRIDQHLNDIIRYLMPDRLPPIGQPLEPTPLVCRKSGLVFMLIEGQHNYLQYCLSECYFPLYPKGEYVRSVMRESRWLAKGCGWYITSMNGVLVVHERYQLRDDDVPMFESGRSIRWQNFEFK
jgi:hypothetical protein